ncbi:MAG: V-type ATPase subunit [Finegoldia sp.]|nr:V-type ATPase subunit [Finegoldia sp.]
MIDALVKSRAKLGRRPNLGDYQRILREDDLEGKINLLKKLDYSDFIDRDLHSIIDIEISLQNKFSQDIKSIAHFLKGRSKDFYQKYMSNYEIMLMQNLIQTLLNDTLADNYHNLKENPFSENIYIKIDMSFNDFVEEMKSTRYYRTLLPFAKADIKDKSEVFLISNALTKFYYRELLEEASKLGRDDREAIRDYLGREIDRRNISMLYRLINFFNLKDTEIFNYLIEGGKDFKAKELKSLSTKDPHEFEEFMKTTKYAYVFETDNFDIDLERAAVISDRKGIRQEKSKLLAVISATRLLDATNRNLSRTLEMDNRFSMEEKMNFIIKETI